MKFRLVLLMAAVILLMAAPLLLSGWLLWSDLSVEDRLVMAGMVEPRIALAGFVLIVAGFVGAALARTLWRAYPGEALKLGEALRVMTGPNPAYRPVVGEGAPELRALAEAVGALADQRDAARQDVAVQVNQARATLEAERNRLAALMADLPLPVIVCNLDGRILLYNNRARLQASALLPDAHGSNATIGLGRSIYGVFDRGLISHALDTLHHRLERAGSQPLASFITTTRAGQLIRVQMAPVIAVVDIAPASPPPENAPPPRHIGGYVLVLENITRALESGAQCDRTVQVLADDTRAALAGIRGSLQSLRTAPDADRIKTAADAIHDELQILTVRLNQSAQEYANTLVSRWPLEEMQGADLVMAVGRRIESRLGLTAKIDDVVQDIWVKVDSYSFTQALTFLASKLEESFAVRLVRLRLLHAGRMLQLELRWAGTAVSSETLLGWQIEPMTVAGETTPLTLRDVADRHGGQLSCGRDSAIQQSFFRLQIPLAVAQASVDAANLVQVESRPEFYDFDLFKRVGEDHAHDDMPLADLAYTVFDTETTGLEPAAGDEIIQFGAVRIVNSRLLRHENIDQLVDPQRRLRPEGIKIHGITEDMVRGQPTIASVLPRFHAFCADTVLVAHNAAFDMRFLQLKEEKLDIRFNHPLLDTLLLSAVIHPNQESHKLEAIAERLGITIIGRHTALGDAIVTAEVFLRMLPLLAAMGIHTLGQARAAAEKTYYARIKY
ncbi:MAG: exonuclease domain-containing protein [Rhodocyclaceae bacterium]|nr:exonuclease domain-containing protein [Rhodocyclaceae bacterium]